MTNLPSPDQVRAEIEIRIEQVVVNDHQSTTETVGFDTINGGVRTRGLETVVYKVEDCRVDGQLPSKAFLTSDGLVLTFYCSDSLPNRARPFAGGPVYVMWFYVSPGDTFEYDGQIRMFIDQIQSPTGQIVYVVMFGQQQYEQIVLTAPKRNNDTAWQLNLATE